MCSECAQLKSDLARAMGQLQKSADPATRKAAEQFLGTLRRQPGPAKMGSRLP